MSVFHGLSGGKTRQPAISGPVPAAGRLATVTPMLRTAFTAPAALRALTLMVCAPSGTAVEFHETTHGLFAQPASRRPSSRILMAPGLEMPVTVIESAVVPVTGDGSGATSMRAAAQAGPAHRAAMMAAMMSRGPSI